MPTYSSANTDSMSHRPLTSCFNIIFPCSFCSSIILFLYFHFSPLTSVRLSFPPHPACLCISWISLHPHSVCSPYHTVSYLSLSVSLIVSLYLSFALLISLSVWLCLSLGMEEMQGGPYPLTNASGESSVPIILAREQSMIKFSVPYHCPFLCLIFFIKGFICSGNAQ